MRRRITRSAGREPVQPDPILSESRAGPIRIAAAALGIMLIVLLVLYGLSQPAPQQAANAPAAPQAAAAPPATASAAASQGATGKTGAGTTGQGATNRAPNPQEQDPIEQNTRP